MEPEIYFNIVSHIRKSRGLTRTCMKQLVKLFPEQSYDTLFSILSLEYQKRMKCNHMKTQMNKNKYWELYLEGVKNMDSPGIIVRIAERLDVAPCLVAKLILSQYFENNESSGSSDQVTLNVNSYLRDTTLIPDMNLASEIFLCTLYDNIYSPLTETMRSSVGQQYEVKLCREVTKLGLGFRDEEHLRKHGYDKTPDCKLEVPVMIDGLVVNWIESKALFGDEDVHKDYMKNQYLSYWNRFGPGLVIYWFGYVQTIVEPNDKRFTIRDHVPQNMIHISPPNFEMDDTPGTGT
ncbi:CDAN1-interacting nuclease 1 [Leptinotarsa decemlineata]|uniref:CDAN1-interacting nuclease 1 n=1 Tax=Leptinotarsa decemlineata TaxID=7539 RepID=UPI003D309878